MLVGSQVSPLRSVGSIRSYKNEGAKKGKENSVTEGAKKGRENSVTENAKK